MKDMENKIKNQTTDIPESLSVDAMKAKLYAMSEEEKIKRAAGEDVPVFESEAKASGKNVVSFKRYLYPAVGAAALFLVFGISLMALRNGGGMKSSSTASYEMADSAAPESEEAMAETDAVAGEAATESVASYASAASASSAAAASDSADAEDTDPASYDDILAYLEKQEQEQHLLYEMDYDLLTNDASSRDIEKVEEDAEESIAFEAESDATSSDRSKNAFSATTGEIAKAEESDHSETNVRTEGVMEGDIVKTDGKYLYVYDESTECIRIYLVGEGKIEKKVSQIRVDASIDTGSEIYITDNNLIIIGDAYDYDTDANKTVIAVYDIRDKENPALKQLLSQDGTYNTSRFTDGYLYTFTSRYVYPENMRKEEPRTYIPSVDDELLPRHRIRFYPNVKSFEYLIITALKPEEDTFCDEQAILGGSDLLYVSGQKIYLGDVEYDWENFARGEQSLLTSYDYKNGTIQESAKGMIPGYLNDDYSLDEKDGHLRLVTTYQENGNTFNALYILDENLERISVIKRIAEGETIKSARFLEDTAYFVTYRQTDPLFAVDLSDEEDPKILGYLKIPGFSAYLHPFGEGKLLGIGYDDDGSIKVSVFDISNPERIRELDKKVFEELTDASVLENRNAFYCDPDRGLFGFSSTIDSYLVTDFLPDQSYYIMYSYDIYSGFEEQMVEGLGADGNNMAITRGVRIGNYFYLVIAGKKIISYDMEYMEKVAEYTE